MSGPEFRTVYAGVRPARLAVLIEQGDAAWQDTCRRIIECIASIWGGKHSIIVPTDGSAIDAVFWQMLEAYDPDYICEYGKTGLDLKIGSPKAYQEWLEREARAYYKDEKPDADDIERIDRALSASDFQRAGIAPELQHQLKARLSPFFFEDDVIQYCLQARSEPGYPLTPLSVVLPHCRHPDRLIVASSDVDGVPPLWVESILGATYQEQAERIEAFGVHIENQAFGSPVFRLVTTQLRGDDQLKPDHVANSPFEFSMAALSQHRSVAERTRELSAVVVAGSTVRDFALYFGLSRIRARVCWFLPAWLDTFKEAALREKSGGEPVSQSEQHASQFANALHNAVTARTVKDIYFISASLSSGELARVIENLAGTSLGAGSTVRERGSVLSSTRELFSQPRVVFNTNNFAVPTTQQVLEGKACGFFPTPKPKGFETIVPYEHRWISELRIDGLTYPRHPALGAWLLGHHLLSTQEARTGRQGLCYVCPNVAYFGGDVDTILIRPELRVPAAETVFRRLADSAGVSCKLSDKGFFSRDLVEKMSGLEYAAALLRQPHQFGVLRAFLSDNKTQQAAGLYLASDRRRYLRLSDVTAALGNPTEAVSLVDALVGRGIMHRGTVLKCQFCRTADWFSMKDLDDEFRCKRCARKQPIQSRHVLGQNEPVWHYKLDEIIFQGMSNDMHVPLLALDYLRRKSAPFSYADELEFWRQNEPMPFIEIDLCCICDGVLTIGEAKTTGRIEGGGTKEGRCLRKYREAAVLLGARRFVLATSQTWSAQTLANATAAFAGTAVEIMYLDGAQIMGAT